MVPDPENYLTFFLKMEEVKFKSKVVPGDTLIFKLELELQSIMLPDTEQTKFGEFNE